MEAYIYRNKFQIKIRTQYLFLFSFTVTIIIIFFTNFLFDGFTVFGLPLHFIANFLFFVSPNRVSISKITISFTSFQSTVFIKKSKEAQYYLKLNKIFLKLLSLRTTKVKRTLKETICLTNFLVSFRKSVNYENPDNYWYRAVLHD